MTLIKKREALDIFINQGESISICHPDVEDIETGTTKDIIVTIEIDDIDTVVNELLRLKKEYYEIKEEEANNG